MSVMTITILLSDIIQCLNKKLSSHVRRLDQIIKTLGYSYGSLKRLLTCSPCNLINGDGNQSSRAPREYHEDIRKYNTMLGC